MEKEKRIRMFELMNYDEFWNPSKALDWLNKVACDYIGVVHDKDVQSDGSKKNKHYHIVVRLKDARTLSEIAEKCGIEKQYIEIKNKFKDACAYCFHLTSNARKENKFQYDATAVIGSKHVSYEEVFQRSVDYDVKAEREKKIKELLYKYGDCLITRGDVMKEISAEDYDKFGLTFRKMREYRIMKVRNREMNYTEEDIACFGIFEEKLKECGNNLLSYDYSHRTFESYIDLCIEIETILYRARIKLIRQLNQVK